MRMARLLLVAGGLLALGAGAAAAPPGPAADVPATFVAAGEAGAGLPRLHSLLVSWRGTTLLERYYHGSRVDRLADLKSVSKSVLSALVGIAIDRGLLKGVDQPIGPFFPELADQSAKRAITIGDLLTMQSGLASTSNRNYGAWVQSRNWVRYVLSRDLLDPPGTEMRYSTGNTHLLSAILTKATGESTWQFADRALARPLGFNLAPWMRDPQGIYFGGNEMAMTPREMLAFGELYRNHGRLNGRRVVSDAWVTQSFTVRTYSPRSGQAYGYGWWSNEFAGYETYFAWGYGGQYIFIVPALDLTVVTTSAPTPGDERRENRDGIFDLLERQIIPSVASLAGADQQATGASGASSSPVR
jgi:CubicO group peptidase (beta-lactamase class C family)